MEVSITERGLTRDSLEVPGGDVGLTMRADHVDRSVPEGRSTYGCRDHLGMEDISPEGAEG